MAITFSKTDAVIARGRGVKPISQDVLDAIETALRDKTNVLATVTDAEAKDLVNNFNRLRRHDEKLVFTVSKRPGKKPGTMDVLLADVSRTK